MLSMSKYPKEYISECRSRVASDVAAYKSLAAAAGDAAGAFEPVFFNNMVMVLDAYFCHRARTLDGKDGNPLNEVRVLCSSMMLHDDVMTADKSIKLSPDGSVVKVQFGERIALTEGDFSRLSAAFFSELESKYL
jgi:hypothetical protein